jgi:SnoaL-like domain
MATRHASTRRSFIWTAGAAFSAPLAAAAAVAPAAPPETDDPLARLAMLEDVNAIRALNHAYARHIGAAEHQQLAALFANPSDARIDPDVRAIVPYAFGEDDVVEVAADRQTATARLHCTLHAESAIGPSCPLVEMAREQGGGVVRRTERVVIEHDYVRREGVWKIRRSTHRPA